MPACNKDDACCTDAPDSHRNTLIFKLQGLEQRITRLEQLIQIMERRLVQANVLSNFKSAWAIYTQKKRRSP